MNALSRGLLLLLALVAPALSLAKTYKGPEAPKPGMAVLNGEQRRIEDMYGKGIYGYIGMRIGVVDGDSKARGLYATSYPTAVHVAPGRHTVRVQYADAYYAGQAFLWFDAEADKAYTARFDTSGTSIRYWIEETATSLPVGGIGDGKDDGIATASAPVAQASPSAGGPPVSEEKAANPPPVPDAGTAVLVSDPGDGPTSQWSSWDGKNIRYQEVTVLDGKRKQHRGNGYQSFRLKPGRHTLEIRYIVGTSSVSSKIAFSVEAGRTYWIRRITESYETRFWIEEAANGATVSEVIR